MESEAHDSRPDEHAARVEKVRSALASRREVTAAVNAAGHIHLYGYAATAADPNVDATNFRTALSFRVGYGVP